MNTLDRELLEALQFDFPLVPRPFAVMGEKIGMSENAVIAAVMRLKKGNIVRQISAIFDSSKIGYTSTLAAFRVDPARIETVAASLSLLPGVSHNYQREGNFNLWFTLTMESGKNLEKTIAKLARENNVSEWLYLPSIRQFKISFRLPMGSMPAKRPPENDSPESTAKPPKINKNFVRELQKDLPVCSRPFRAAARRLGTTEAAVLNTMRRYVEHRIARRFAAVLRQTNAGFAANVMVAWAPGGSEKEKLGKYAAGLPLVSHCYERPVSATWPYSVYTMIHGKTMQDCERAIRDIARKSGVKDYCPLRTIREFKKQRIEYFAGK